MLYRISEQHVFRSSDSNNGMYDLNEATSSITCRWRKPNRYAEVIEPDLRSVRDFFRKARA